MYNLQGKTALVTGAGGQRGIGRAIAMRLAREGCHLVLNDIHPGNPDHRSAGTWGGMAQVVDEIRQLGRQALGVVASVSDSRQVQAMVRQAVEQFGGIDILVNNAGARAGTDRVPVVELEESEWDRVHATNAKGTFLCCQAVARQMLAQGRGGRIINISSTAGKTGRATYGAYCASKFAVIGLTQALAQELAPQQITVNAICPSLVATERVEHMVQAAQTRGLSAEEHRQAMLARATALSPLGRMAEVDDVANVAAFLASDQAAYLTGVAISVAGGAQMH